MMLPIVQLLLLFGGAAAASRRGCVVSVRIGSSVQAGGIPESPWHKNQSFFFISPSNSSAMMEAQEKGWTPLLLSTTIIALGEGPTAMSGAAEGRRSAPRVKLRWTASDIENMQAKYVKILSHRIPRHMRRCPLYGFQNLLYARHRL